MIDYHMHTNLCKHATGSVNQYVEQALSIGLTEIAFTDHIPMPDNFDIDHRMSIDEMDLYQSWIEEARNRYPEMKILFGIEADYYKGYEDFIYAFLNKYEFDLVIMSVHFIQHWPENNWVFDYNFRNKPIYEIYADYLDVVIQGVQTDMFDVVGHVDMIKRPNHSLLSIIPETVTQFFDAVKNTEMVIEINTSGFRKKTKETYPGLDWLAKLAEYNIPICTGSDAHKPEQVGMQFKSVYDEFARIPALQFAQFDKRNRTILPLN